MNDDDNIVPSWDLPNWIRYPLPPLDLSDPLVTHRIADNFTGLVKAIYDSALQKGLDHPMAFAGVMKTTAGRKFVNEVATRLRD